MTPDVLFAVVPLAIGGVSWAIRLEAKANGANEKYDALHERFSRLEDRFDDLKDAILQAHLADRQ